VIREHRAALLAALLAAAAGAALEYRLGHPQAPEPVAAQPPATLPTLELRDLEGRSVRLPDAYAGKILLLNFWASWCGPCIGEMAELQRYSAKQPSNGVQVIGIALDDPTAVADFLKLHPVAYSILLDRPGPNDSSVRLGDRGGVLPYSVLVAADGHVLHTQLGPFAKGEIDRWARIEPPDARANTQTSD
jgi:thiol-disulfide isomerase/thioredoxin